VYVSSIVGPCSPQARVLIQGEVVCIVFEYHLGDVRQGDDAKEAACCFCSTGVNCYLKGVMFSLLSVSHSAAPDDRHVSRSCDVFY
jgi:hypothetical protein